MKHIIIGLLTALVLAAPAQAQRQRPQGPVSKAPPVYEIVKDWRKEMSKLKREVATLRKEVEALKKAAKEHIKKGRARSRRPFMKGRRSKSQGHKGMKKNPIRNKKR